MKKKILLPVILILLLFYAGFGVSAFNLVNLQKADGSGTVKYRGTTVTVQIPNAFDTQDSDFRAVWVSHLVYDISPYQDKNQYMEEMNEVFDIMEYFNMNAIIFHVRTHNNALYDSNLNPVASYYENVNFDVWDPLTWMISEAHRRGIEFHAWMNPYRITTSNSLSLADLAATFPSNNLASNPDYLIASGKSVILNPGEPAVRDFIISTVMEVIEKYDVDAIHFDDYFYISGLDDTATRNKYNTEHLSIENFRRKQVDLFIEELSQTMRDYNQATNRVVQLGISPSGIYRNGSYVSSSNYKYDSNGNLTSPLASNTSGFAHYGNYLYSDTKKWIDNEWIDYILPQSYWAFEHPNAGFADVMDWWSAVVKYKDVNLYSGMGFYMIAENATVYSWLSNNEAYHQVLYGTKHPEIKGHSVYSFKHLRYAYEQRSGYFYENFKRVKEEAWKTPSILPEVKTYQPITLGAVNNLTAARITGGYQLQFQGNGAKFYAIYRSQNPITYNPDELIDVIGANGTVTYNDSIGSGKYYYGIKPISDTNTLGTGAEVSIDTYTVTFRNYNGNVLKIESVKSGETATPPVVPIRTGYTFTGWDKDFSAVTSDLEVNALFEINTYTVIFQDDEGVELKRETVNYGNDATPPLPPDKVGNEFIGWSNSYTDISSDLTISAQYRIKTYQVIFKDGNTVLKTEIVDHGKEASIADPVKTGYTFIGWDKDFSAVTSDLEVQAIFEINSYTVQFRDYDGSLLKEETVDYGSDATPPTPSIRKGYVFTGWDFDYRQINSDRILTAQYEEGFYSIRFMAGDTLVLEVHSDEEFVLPEIPAKDGYDQIAPVWSRTDFTGISGDIIVLAVYTINTYNVKFIGFDGEIIKEETVEWMQDATPPTPPIIDGYQFKEWDKEYSEITSDVEINALYTEKAKEIRFSCAGLTIQSAVFMLGTILFLIFRRKR